MDLNFTKAELVAGFSGFTVYIWRVTSTRGQFRTYETVSWKRGFSSTWDFHTILSFLFLISIGSYLFLLTSPRHILQLNLQDFLCSYVAF
jgi:hypothetical protein